MKTVARALLLIGALIAPSIAAAQDFPTKTVTFVVPFGAGSSSDIMGRYAAENLSKLWKQPVVIENRSGAGSASGTAYASKAKPDGYTLLFTSSSYTTNAAVQRNLPFDPIKDFQPVAMTASGQMALFAGSRLPIASMDDLIKQAKAQKVFFGSTGTGSVAHFIMELLQEKFGIKLEPVSYKSVPEAFIDLGGGRIDVFVASVTSGQSTVANNRARTVAIIADTRSKLLPNVPTAAETGHAGFEIIPWWGLMAPAGTPSDIVAKIRKDLATVMSTPEAKEFLEKNETVPRDVGPDEFTKIVRDEITRFRALADKNNLVAN